MKVKNNEKEKKTHGNKTLTRQECIELHGHR